MNVSSLTLDINEIYEQILKGLQAHGSYGEYYTPKVVTDFMVHMVLLRK